MAIFIDPAREADHIATARGLFADYATWLEADHGISLAFQGIEAELAGLPGKYAPPAGEILLARDVAGDMAGDMAGAVLGVIALRPFEGSTCEVKRLYVPHSARGQGVARQLVERLLEVARSRGYRRAILDTGPFMLDAQRLYERCGFTDIASYYDNPYPGIRFMGRDL